MKREAAGRAVVALVSGGLDSSCVVERLLRHGHHVWPVYVRCGLIWEGAEAFWLRRWLLALADRRLGKLHVIRLPVRSLYGKHWSLTGRDIPSHRSADSAVYLPGRNVLLVTCAGIVCVKRRAHAMALGTLQGNPFGDASPGFFRHLARCLTGALDYDIQILTPLIHTSKAELIQSARTAPLRLTFSCLRPHGRHHCGRCNKCAERQRGFRRAGIPDPTTYAQ